MKEIEQDALRTAEDHFAESPSLEERVARIEARDRVEELLAHYARCVDAQDAQGVGAAFTEDGEMCNPGMPALKGRARITKLYGKLLPAFLRSGAVLARGVARSASCSMGMFEWESPFFHVPSLEWRIRFRAAAPE